MAIPEKFAFKKGWEQLPQKSLPEARMRIMDAIGGCSLNAFYARMNGTVEPKASEFLKIQEVFNSYGITDIWG